MLSTIHSSIQDYFQAEICIIVYCYYENAFFFSRSQSAFLLKIPSDSEMYWNKIKA